MGSVEPESASQRRQIHDADFSTTARAFPLRGLSMISNRVSI